MNSDQWIAEWATANPWPATVALGMVLLAFRFMSRRWF